MKTIIITAILCIASAPAFAGDSVNRDTREHGPVLREKVKAERKADLTKAEALLLVKSEKRLLDAIQAVETGGEKEPAKAVGDKGKAIGPMQIHVDYWRDASTQMHTTYVQWTMCTDEENARIVVALYWRKYHMYGRSSQEKALIHHYGYTKWSKNKTDDPDGYWKKVQAKMK